MEDPTISLNNGKVNLEQLKEEAERNKRIIKRLKSKNRIKDIKLNLIYELLCLESIQRNRENNHD